VGFAYGGDRTPLDILTKCGMVGLVFILLVAFLVRAIFPRLQLSGLVCAVHYSGAGIGAARSPWPEPLDRPGLAASLLGEVGNIERICTRISYKCGLVLSQLADVS
jgi:hypothetical protein